MRAIEWHVAPNLPVVQADPNLLRQALLHVLDNAVKFTAPREHAVVDIEPAPAQDGQHVVLQVRDNGAGFNPAQQGQLFRVFGRLHSAQQFDGVGMGLVLTRKILQRLGGAVEIDGEVGAGCCVRMHLPLS